MTAFAEFAAAPRWIAWRNELRGERLTKIPYGAGGRPAKADDPNTWLIRAQAETLHQRLTNGVLSGIGFELGPCDAELAVGGIDLDTCRDPASGMIESWAQQIIDRFGSYTEISPSQHGAKIFFLYDPSKLEQLRTAMGGHDGRKYATASRGDHPPAIELYLNRRYFAVTEQHLSATSPELESVSITNLLWLINVAGPAFAHVHDVGLTANGSDNSRSAIAFRKGAALRRGGLAFPEMCAALARDPETKEWVQEKGLASHNRELKRIWERGVAEEESRQPWEHIQLDEWAARGEAVAEREWIMEGWIPRGQTTGLYGVSGVLKTMFLLQLMLSASAGLSFCGLPIAEVPVLGLFCEDTKDEILRRLQRIAKLYRRDLDTFPNFHFVSLVGHLDTELLLFDRGTRSFGPAQEKFLELVEDVKPGLVILDTLPDFFGGDEISRRQTSQFIRYLDGVGMTGNCAMLCAAHPSVRGQASKRLDSGNTGIEGKMRARLTLHDPDQELEEEGGPSDDPITRRILTRQNSNYAKPGEIIELIYVNEDGKSGFMPAAIDPTQAQKHGQIYELAVRSKFKEILAAVNAEGSHVGENERGGARFYAPRRFYSHHLNRKTRHSIREFAIAMDQLLGDKEIYLKRTERGMQLLLSHEKN